MTTGNLSKLVKTNSVEALLASGIRPRHESVVPGDLLPTVFYG